MKKDGIPAGLGNQKTLYGKAFLIELAFSVCALLLFALVMTVLGVGFSYAAVFATLSVAIGAFAASFYLAKKIKKNGWLLGVAVGGINFLVLTVTGLFLSADGVTSNTVFRFIILMLCALIGGILGVEKADSRRYL